MKKVFILLFLLSLLFILLYVLPGFCFAESDITLAWDCNCPDITGYRVYRSQTSGIYDPNNPVSVIKDPNITIITHYELPDGIYFWVVTSYEEHIPTKGLSPIFNESGYSNEATANLKTLNPHIPVNNKIQRIIKIDVVVP